TPVEGGEAVNVTITMLDGTPANIHSLVMKIDSAGATTKFDITVNGVTTSYTVPKGISSITITSDTAFNDFRIKHTEGRFQIGGIQAGGEREVAITQTVTETGTIMTETVTNGTETIT